MFLKTLDKCRVLNFFLFFELKHLDTQKVCLDGYPGVTGFSS